MIRYLPLPSLALLGGCSGFDTKPAEQDASCAIITEFVAEEFDQASKPLFLSLEKPLPPQDSKAWVSAYEAAPHPVDACPKLAKIRKERSYAPPKRAPDEPLETSADGLFYLYDTLSVSLPILDGDGESYRFEVARFCGPLCADGNTVIYRLQSDGSWGKDREEPNWIS